MYSFHERMRAYATKRLFRTMRYTMSLINNIMPLFDILHIVLNKIIEY